MDPSGEIQEPMAEDTAVEAGTDVEVIEDSAAALLLRAYASHFWTNEQEAVWNALLGERNTRPYGFSLQTALRTTRK